MSSVIATHATALIKMELKLLERESHDHVDPIAMVCTSFSLGIVKN